jgi:hypothetical protein
MFKNPIAPKTRKSSRTFAAPTKGEATTGRSTAAGDFYGTGFRAKIGRVRGSSSSSVPSKSKCFEPPKSLA